MYYKYSLLLLLVIFTSCSSSSYNTYFKNGKIKSICEGYQNDSGEIIKHGKYIVYDENHFYCKEYQYNNNLIQGKYTEWWIDIDGKKRIACKGNYKEGKKNGIFSYYHDTSENTKYVEENFKMGQSHGDWYVWYASGKLISHIIYDNGIPLKAIYYKENGNIDAEGTYRKGKPWDGSFLTDINLNGKTYLYYKEGRLIKEKRIENFSKQQKEALEKIKLKKLNSPNRS